MDPNSFACRHIISSQNIFLDSDKRHNLHALRQFTRYKIHRIKNWSKLRSIAFLFLCLQILSISLQYKNTLLWTSPYTRIFVQFFSYISFTGLINLKVGFANAEIAFFLIVFFLDVILYVISFVCYKRLNRVPLPLLYASKYIEIIITIIFHPGYFVMAGRLIYQSQSASDFIVFILFLLLMILRSYTTISIIQNTLAVQNQLYNTTNTFAALKYLYFVAILSFFWEVIGERVFNEKILPIVTSLFLIIFLIQEIYSTIWL